jgi:DNA invertase Pin-like site-specific DNA recombinase
MCKSYVAYYRVSTQKQGVSGLGLEAQQQAVEAFIASKGQNAKLLASFVEVESGKQDDRPQLTRAIESAKLAKATVLVAKLDRLARNAGFLFKLKDSGVDLAAADMPDMNTLMFGIMATVAQHEREQISARTKAALAAAKARGVKLGNPHGAEALIGRRNLVKAREANSAMADSRAEPMREIMGELGHLSANAAANALNRRGILAARGGAWSAKAVIRLRSRLAAAVSPGVGLVGGAYADL